MPTPIIAPNRSYRVIYSPCPPSLLCDTGQPQKCSFKTMKWGFRIVPASQFSVPEGDKRQHQLIQLSPYASCC